MILNERNNMRRYRNISEVLDAVSKAETRKEKIEILRFNHSISLKQIFILAYHPDYNYIKIPEYQKIKNGMGMQMKNALKFLEFQIAKGGLKGRMAEKELLKILVSVTADEATVLEKVMKQDMQCGVGKGIAKKVWGKDLYK